jgi:hypothetical protein
LTKLEHKIHPLPLTKKENIIMVVSYISIGLLAQYIGLWVVIGRKNYVQAPIDSS